MSTPPCPAGYELSTGEAWPCPSQETDQHLNPLFLGFPKHHRGCSGSKQVHMFCCAPAPHKMRPPLCRNRALHFFDRLYTADNIQAFQGAIPHQSSEGHHRGVFAGHLQVSAHCPCVSLLCVYLRQLHLMV